MRLDDAAGILARADFFDICEDEELRMLGFASDRQRFGTDDVVYQAGDRPLGALVLVEGTVRARHERDQASEPYELNEPGSVISPTALIIDKPRPVTFTAVTECELLFVPRSAFLKLARQNPELARRAAERIQQDLGRYMHALEPLRHKMKSG
jgi:CRP-like cAMP-binding protein